MLDTLAVIGVGLIGGSFARALKAAAAFRRVVGIDRDQKNLDEALRLGVIDEAARTVAEGVAAADMVFVAVPVCSIAQVVAAAAPHLKHGAVVTDGGSVKEEIVTVCEPLMRPGTSFVGGHPIAGTEHSGAAASFATLFEKRRCILTPTASTDRDALSLVRSAWEAAGSCVEYMDARAHDRVFAAVSHLPHMVAYALVHAVDRSAEQEENILAFSAGGFRDFTRIASSDPVMWRDIAVMNRSALLDMLDCHQAEVESLRERIAAGDADWLEEYFTTSKRLRDSIMQR